MGVDGPKPTIHGRPFWPNFDARFAYQLNLAYDWVYNQKFEGFWFLDEKSGHVIDKLELIFMIVSPCINLFCGE